MTSKLRDKIRKQLYEYKYGQAAMLAGKTMRRGEGDKEIDDILLAVKAELVGDKVSLTDIYGTDWRNNYGFTELQVRDAARALQQKQHKILDQAITKEGISSHE